MGQKRSYKQYSKEFKEEAVALIREQGYSVPEAAKSLGIARDHGVRSCPVPHGSQVECARLLYPRAIVRKTD